MLKTQYKDVKNKSISSMTSEKTYNSGYNMQKKIIAEVDDEISTLIRRVELNYGLTYEEARNSINLAIKNLEAKKISNI
ncbi:MAG: hypothetical protein WC867_00340 [Candidatus Pacearchaeota archaeon]|jgi:hypothetical protein